MCTAWNFVSTCTLVLVSMGTLWLDEIEEDGAGRYSCGEEGGGWGT